MKQRTIGVLVAGALAVALAIATLGSACARPQPGYGPGGIMVHRRDRHFVPRPG
jgi:hypothetical protein